jgi:hypothetical protein
MALFVATCRIPESASTTDGRDKQRIGTNRDAKATGKNCNNTGRQHALQQQSTVRTSNNKQTQITMAEKIRDVPPPCHYHCVCNVSENEAIA